MLPAKFSKEVLIGATDDSVVAVTVSIGSNSDIANQRYVSFTHNEFSREFFDSDQGQQMAVDMLEDGEEWKAAVDAGKTEKGKDDWNQERLDEGWEELIGDIHQVVDLYTRLESGGAGAGPAPEKYKILAISKKDLLFIHTEALKLHLKNLKEIDKYELVVLRAVLEKYPEFNDDQMEMYSTELSGPEDDGEDRKNPTGPFTATWPPQPPHESPPPPPINIPADWWDDEKRTVLAEREEEMMDLVVDKFWRGDPFITETVTTKGAHFGQHNDEGGYEWAKWEGEYTLGIGQYGPEDPSLPLGTILRTIEVNGVDTVYHVMYPIKVRTSPDQIVTVVDERLYLRSPFEEVTKHGAPGWLPDEAMMSLPTAIDKVHFTLRKTLMRGPEHYPILQRLRVSTFTHNGVEPEMTLEAVDSEGSRQSQYKSKDIPSAGFNFDRSMRKKDNRTLYIQLERAPSGGTSPALDTLGFHHRVGEELGRIFNVGLEPVVSELPYGPSKIGEIQERVDSIERDIRMLRVKEKDFNSSNSEVAARLGKQDEYDKLMRERDEQMWRGNPIKKLSADTVKMLQEKRGYRTESAYGSGVRRPSDVVRYEWYELDNQEDYPLDNMIEALNLPNNLTADEVFLRIEQDYDDKYEALWLAEKGECKELYCDPGEEPEEYKIPDGAIVLQDLGPDGALFLMPKLSHGSRENPGPRRVVTGADMKKRATLPKYLYHGTSMGNLKKVLEQGLLVHQMQSPYTVESGHEEDTNMNVSLANTVQDAVFFSLGAAGWGADQAIIEFDTTNMTEKIYPTILRRPLFGKKGRFEYKVYTMKGVPPEHISRVLIRSFSKPAGHLEVTEKWYTREQAMTLPSS